MLNQNKLVKGKGFRKKEYLNLMPTKPLFMEAFEPRSIFIARRYATKILLAR